MRGHLLQYRFHPKGTHHLRALVHRPELRVQSGFDITWHHASPGLGGLDQQFTGALGEGARDAAVQLHDCTEQCPSPIIAATLEMRVGPRFGLGKVLVGNSQTAIPVSPSACRAPPKPCGYQLGLVWSG